MTKHCVREYLNVLFGNKCVLYFQQMLQRLYTEGSATEGIFRTCPSRGKCRQLKSVLDKMRESRYSADSDSSSMADPVTTMSIFTDISEFSVSVVANVVQVGRCCL